jgi:hypothetical protein
MERDSSGDVLAESGREIVDHVDVVTPRDERLDDMRADESGSSGNDD